MSQSSVGMWEWPVGAAEEERHHDRRHGDGVHELGQEEQREADGRVLGVEPADQLVTPPRPGRRADG